MAIPGKPSWKKDKAARYYEGSSSSYYEGSSDSDSASTARTGHGRSRTQSRPVSTRSGPTEQRPAAGQQEEKPYYYQKVKGYPDVPIWDAEDRFFFFDELYEPCVEVYNDMDPETGDPLFVWEYYGKYYPLERYYLEHPRFKEEDSGNETERGHASRTRTPSRPPTPRQSDHIPPPSDSTQEILTKLSRAKDRAAPKVKLPKDHSKAKASKTPTVASSVTSKATRSRHRRAKDPERHRGDRD